MREIYFLLLALVSCYSLNYRIGKLEEYKMPVIDLDATLFQTFTEEPRNYTVYVMLTTKAEDHNCVACRGFQPEFELVAKGYKKLGLKKSMYFTVLDYRKGIQIFQQLKVQNVPMVLRFPPTNGPLAIGKPFDIYDVTKYGFSADKFAESVNSLYGISITITRPVDYTKHMVLAGIGLSVLAILRFAYRYAYNFASLKTPWQFMVLVFGIDKGLCVVMCSGYMWNTIRQPPFIAMGRNGAPAYFAQGFQQQYAVETVMVGFCYALISFSVIVMTVVAPKMPEGNIKGAVYAGLLLFVLSYSAIMFIFRIKFPNYPYKLVFYTHVAFLVINIRALLVHGLVFVYK